MSNAQWVVFDLDFTEPSTNRFGQPEPAIDEEFAGAIREHGRVLLASSWIPWLNFERPPVEPLASAAPHAPANLPYGGDGGIRRHLYLQPKYPGHGLAGKAAQLFKNDAPGPAGNRWINYRLACKSVRYSELRDPSAIPAAFFRNTVLFVGGAGDDNTPDTLEMQPDIHPTALTLWTGQRMSGVEIHAIAFLNLVHHEWLELIPGPVELLLVVGIGLLSGFGLVSVRPSIGLALSVAGVVALASLDLYLVSHQHLWFAWAVPALVQIPCALGWASLVHLLRSARQQKASAVESSTPSTVIIADHALLLRIGEGAYGEVWLARNLVGLYRAVKVIRRQKFADAVPFEREFRGIQKFMPVSLNHPGLLRVLHVGRDDPERYFFYIMEPADDQNTGQQIDPGAYGPQSLHSVLAKRGHLPLGECVELGLSLCEALGYLHGQNLIHRDLKPSNIIFVNGRPKIADIGLVTDLGSLRTAVTSLGTPGYMAPEGPGTLAGDVFSLGRMLYEAWTGLDCRGFPTLPPELMARAGDPAVIQMNRLLLRACEADPARRYGSVAPLGDELRRLRDRLSAPTAG